jgi:hypothetical protein
MRTYVGWISSANSIATLATKGRLITVERIMLRGELFYQIFGLKKEIRMTSCSDLNGPFFIPKAA